MGERKVLNKYFPPDFDPRYVPKTKWDPFKQIETRMMIPFNIQVRVSGWVWAGGRKRSTLLTCVFLLPETPSLSCTTTETDKPP